MKNKKILNIAIIIGAIMLCQPKLIAQEGFNGIGTGEAVVIDLDAYEYPLNQAQTLKIKYALAEGKLIISGRGEIDKEKWDKFKSPIGINTIEFKNEGIQLPEDSSNFFSGFTNKQTEETLGVAKDTITSLVGLENLDVSKVKNFTNMFKDSKAENLNKEAFKKWKPKEGAILTDMFTGAEKIIENLKKENLDITNLDTIKNGFKEITPVVEKTPIKEIASPQVPKEATPTLVTPEAETETGSKEEKKTEESSSKVLASNSESTEETVEDSQPELVEDEKKAVKPAEEKTSPESPESVPQRTTESSPEETKPTQVPQEPESPSVTSEPKNEVAGETENKKEKTDLEVPPKPSEEVKEPAENLEPEPAQGTTEAESPSLTSSQGTEAVSEEPEKKKSESDLEVPSQPSEEVKEPAENSVSETAQVPQEPESPSVTSEPKNKNETESKEKEKKEESTSEVLASNSESTGEDSTPDSQTKLVEDEKEVVKQPAEEKIPTEATEPAQVPKATVETSVTPSQGTEAVSGVEEKKSKSNLEVSPKPSEEVKEPAKNLVPETAQGTTEAESPSVSSEPKNKNETESKEEEKKEESPSESLASNSELPKATGEDSAINSQPKENEKGVVKQPAEEKTSPESPESVPQRTTESSPEETKPTQVPQEPESSSVTSEPKNKNKTESKEEKKKEIKPIKYKSHNVLMGNMSSITILSGGEKYISAGLEKVNKNLGTTAFSEVGASKDKYETGSHIETNIQSGAFGLGKKIQLKDKTLINMAFIDYGFGNYKAFSEVGEGSGDVKYIGGALATRYQTKENLYADASIKLGKVENNAKDILANERKTYGYKTKNKYFGGHLGLGKITKLTENTSVDVYGKYIYTNISKNNFKIDKDEYKLDKVNSSILNLSLKVNHELNTSSIYYGITYSYELDGKSRGTVNGEKIKSADISGSTIISELGLRKKISNESSWEFDLGLKKYNGKHNGLSGNFGIIYNF